MAVVAAGSLVLFSILARQAALTPGPGAMVVPRKAPRVSDRSVINVSHPSNKIVLPQGSDNRSGPEAGGENPVAQSAPTGSAPTPPPDDTLVASVDVHVPVGGGEEAPFHFPRPKVHIGRNLNPPGDDDDDDGDDDGDDDEDTDGDDVNAGLALGLRSRKGLGPTKSRRPTNGRRPTKTSNPSPMKPTD